MQLNSFRGSVHISDNNVITFDAADSSKRVGIVQLAVDTDSDIPAIEWEKVPVMTEEYLDDGRYVGNFKSMDVSREGSVAVDIVAKTPQGGQREHHMSGLYLQTDNENFQPVFTYGQTFDGGSVFSTGHLGDIDIHDGDDIIFTGHLKSNDDSNSHGYGLVYLPGGSVDSSEVLMSSGDFVPFSNHAMESFGLIDLHDNGHYAVSGFAASLSGDLNSANGEHINNALMVSGNVSTSEKFLLGADEAISRTEITASCFYGPRTTSNGDVYGITWEEDREHMCLYLGNEKIIETQDRSPLGNETLFMSTGSVGEDDSLFYTITSVDDNGKTVQELVHYNGYRHSVLLTTGDRLSDGSPPVETIYFGGTTKQADSYNRIVFYCTFTDGTRALVLGIPA